MNRNVIGNQANESGLKQDLFQALMEELSAYEYLSDTMNEKKQAIIQNDLKKIEHLSGTEQLLVTKANRLTENRFGLMQKFYSANSIKSAPFTLSDFIEMSDKNERATWERIDNRMSKTVENIQRINLENKRLLETSMKYVQGMINLFVPREENMRGLYGKEGAGNTRVSAKNFLDCNA